MSESVSTVEAPARGLPPGDDEPGFFQRYGAAILFLGADARAPRRLDRLSDDPHDHPELLRPRRRRVHRARQLRDALHRRHAPHRDQEQLPLAPDRAGVRHRDRARVRGPPRADPLLGRVQGGRLHADGDLALRRGRDLAADVREGPDPGHDQRRDRGREGRGVARRASSPPRSRRPTTSREGRPAASCSRSRSSRATSRSSASRGSARRRCRPTPCRPSCRRRSPAGSPASSGETSSRAAARPARSKQEELGLPGVTVELRDDSGRSVLETQTEADGTFAFEDVEAGTYRAAIGAGDVLAAVRRRVVARREPDHAGDHDGLHLGLGRASRWS